MWSRSRLRCFVLHGRGDERYQDSMALAYELLQKGVTLNGSFWVQEIANLPHVPRDNTIEAPAPADNAEPLGPYFGAAIRNMRDFLSEGVTPPASHVAGRIVNGALAFDVAGGSTDRIPVREDPALDSIEFGPMVAMRTVDAAMTARWQAVTAVLDHVNEPIVGPSIACRVGAFPTAVRRRDPDALRSRAALGDVRRLRWVRGMRQGNRVRAERASPLRFARRAGESHCGPRTEPFLISATGRPRASAAWPPEPVTIAFA